MGLIFAKKKFKINRYVTGRVPPPPFRRFSRILVPVFSKNAGLALISRKPSQGKRLFPAE